MDLSQVKQIFCKQGEVKRILEGDVVLWEKKGHFSGKVVLISSEDYDPIISGGTELITDFAVGRYAEIMFKADAVPEWSISELPAGLSYEVTSEGLKVAGYATEAGSKDVEISTGSYTQTYTFRIEDDGEVEYGIRITTSNEYPVTDFELNKFASKTFEASFYVPEEEQDSPVEWSFTNLPDGLSASGAILSGTVTKPWGGTISAIVTKGSYRASRAFVVKVYGLVITRDSLPSGKKDERYYTDLQVQKVLPSGVGKLTYYASNLPPGLSLNSSSGTISGTPTASGSWNVSVYATRSPYQSATKTFNLTITAPPGFTVPDSAINLYAGACRDKSRVGTSVGKLNVYGAGFTQYSYAVEWGLSTTYSNTVTFVANGEKSNVDTPEITVSINVVSDTQLTLDFILTKKAAAVGDSVLASRDKTLITIIMYKTSYSNVIGRHTVGVGFYKV